MFYFAKFFRFVFINEKIDEKYYFVRVNKKSLNLFSM